MVLTCLVISNDLPLCVRPQFMTGGTMGWFTYQNQGDAFFLPANAARVAYIQKLSTARIAARKWMVHGRKFCHC